MLAWQQAEMNRDRKKHKKPYEVSDFYCYKIEDNHDTIDAIYSSAASQLIAIGKFPRWGLFIYKELMKNIGKAKAPDVLAYVHESAIILAPKIMNDSCKGLLIATEGVSFRTLSFDIIRNDQNSNEQIRVRMPKIDGKVVAIENCVLDILG